MQSRHTQLSAASTFDNILAPGAKSGMVPHEYVDSLGDAADAGSEVLVNLAGNSLEQIPLDEVKEASGVSFTTTGPDEDTLAAVGLTGRKVTAHATREVTTPVATKGAEGSIQVSAAQVLDSTTPPKDSPSSPRAALAGHLLSSSPARPGP
ncbi:hypothetical protein ACWELB_18865 [Streptomyces asiaticus]